MSRSKHVLVTDPYLFPVSFAKRLTPQQLAKFQEKFAEDLAYSFCTFTVAPYTQALQRKLRNSAEYVTEYVYL